MINCHHCHKPVMSDQEPRDDKFLPQLLGETLEDTHSQRIQT